MLDPLGFGILSATAGYRQCREVFSDRGTAAAYLEVEAALARALARAGVIQPAQAEQIAAACRPELLDLRRLQREADEVGYPIIGLVRQITENSGKAAGWVHWGATTQDIMDSGVMLQLKATLPTVIGMAGTVCENLGALASSYRDTPMAGRSKFQHASPITFGYKAAVWLSQVERAKERLETLHNAGLWLQFGGAVGTLAALGRDGLAVRGFLAQELDLREPSITWHVSRDILSDFVNALALLCASLGKMGLDVAHLAATEIDELREPYAAGRGTSSTMPQKRNPILSETLVAAAKASRQEAQMMLDALVQDHERASNLSHLEYRSVANSVLLAAGAVDTAVTLTKGLEVNAQRMLSNLGATRGMIMAEAAMIELGRDMGRGQAHHLLHDACLKAAQEGSELSETLAPILAERGLGIPSLEPGSYLGAAGEMVDIVLGRGPSAES